MNPVAFVQLERHPRYYFANRVVTIGDRDAFVRHLVSEPLARHRDVHRRTFILPRERDRPAVERDCEHAIRPWKLGPGRHVIEMRYRTR